MSKAVYSRSASVTGEAELNESLSPDGLTCLALCYLTAPLLIFFVTWFTAVPGGVLTLLTLFALRHACLTAGSARPRLPLAKLTALIGLVALAWTTCGGAGHFFYANTLDWMVRDAVLRDITLASGPAAYGFDEENFYILRVPLAYYLPSSSLAKIFGLQYADLFLWVWTALGVGIFLALLPFRWGSKQRLALVLLVPVIFSGMDILGLMYPNFGWGALPYPYAQLDWWIPAPPRVAYISNTAQLFWSPNHAIPAWIATALFYRHWRHASFPSLALILCAVLPLWSPFALIGIFPFVVLATFQSIRRDGARRTDILVALALVPVAAVLLLYLTQSVGTIDRSPGFTAPPRDTEFLNMTLMQQVAGFAKSYTLFVIFEFGVLALLVFRHISRPLIVLSLAILLLLPLLSFGPVNDLGMRGSISALTMLCIAAINYMQSKAFGWKSARAWALAAILLIGSASAATEFYRALMWKRWSPELHFNLKDIAGGAPPPHYMADMHGSVIMAMLRRPSVLPDRVDWFYVCEAMHPDVKKRRPLVPSVRRSRNE